MRRLVEELHSEESFSVRQNLLRLATQICGMQAYVPGYLIKFHEVTSHVRGGSAALWQGNSAPYVLLLRCNVPPLSLRRYGRALVA